jgi:hypothetical protein
MLELTRRGFLMSAGAASAALIARAAPATLVRGLDLEHLVLRSTRVVELLPLEAFSHHVTLGGQRCIVTDTRVQVEGVVAKGAPAQGELWVRVLGGIADGVGELVHGQAELTIGARCLGFLKEADDGMHWVTGMAQGHYPLHVEASGRTLLQASRNLPTIRDWQGSAVRRLAGQPLERARQMVREVAR